MVEHKSDNRHRLVEWFNTVSTTRGFEGKHGDALPSLVPNDFLSGDAIRQVLEVFRFKPSPDILVLNVLSSQLKSDRLLHNIIAKQHKAAIPFRTIVLTINVAETHWYVGALEFSDQTHFQLKTFNNYPKVYNQKAESNLCETGEAYRRFIAQ